MALQGVVQIFGGWLQINGCSNANNKKHKKTTTVKVAVFSLGGMEINCLRISYQRTIVRQTHRQGVHS